MRLLHRSLTACLILAATLAPGCQAVPPVVTPLSQPATDGGFPPGESLASTIPEDAQFVTALAASRRLAYALPEQGDTTGIWQVEVGKPRQRVGELDGPIEGLQWAGDGAGLYFNERRNVMTGFHQIGMISCANGYVSRPYQNLWPLRVVPAPRDSGVVLLRTDGASKLAFPVFAAGPIFLESPTPQVDWPTWSANGRRVAYTSTDDAPAGRVALWASSDRLANGVRLATIAPVEGLFWQAGDRLAVWRMTRVDGRDTELVIQSYPITGGMTTETRIPMTDPVTGQAYIHSAITASPDGSRLLVRRQSPDQSVLVSIADQRIVVQGPTMTFHGWMTGDRFLASQQDGQGTRYFVQPLPPAPAASAAESTSLGVPSMDTDLSFTYEIKPQAPNPDSPHFENGEAGNRLMRLSTTNIQVRLSDVSYLPAFLEKYQATVIPLLVSEYFPASVYVSVKPLESDDLKDLQALGSQAGLRAHYVFHSRAGAAIFQRALRMQLDKRAGVLSASAEVGIVTAE